MFSTTVKNVIRILRVIALYLYITLGSMGISFYLYVLYLFILCHMYRHMCHGTHEEVREPLGGVDSLFPSLAFLGLKLGPQSW